MREVVVGCQQVAAALSFMADKGVVHQDLHPGNILIRPGTLAWTIADFGSAHVNGHPDIRTIDDKDEIGYWFRLLYGTLQHICMLDPLVWFFDAFWPHIAALQYVRAG